MSERDESLESVRPDRSKPKRVSLADQRNVLTHPEANDPGYMYRVVVDYKSKPGRVTKFKNAGYVHVLSGENMGEDAAGKPTKIGAKVMVPTGNGETGYLMKIPKEYYDEDQAVKEKNLKETEASMNRKKKGEYGEGLVKDK